MPQNIDSNVQLLVEGNDQRNFFEAFIDHLSLKNIQIRNYGGVNDLRRFLSGFVTSVGFGDITTLGIVRDAEASAQSAFQSVQDSLRGLGLAVPGQLGQRAGSSPAVSVLILPDDDNSGMLETLLCRTFVGTYLDTCIDGFFECVRAKAGEGVYRPEKARAHAYLATRRDPHVSVGVAAHRKYWDLDHAALSGVRQFLQSL